MDCSWCGKSTVYFNHDRCWDDWVAADPGPIPQTGDVDPWDEMFRQFLGEDVPDVEES